MRPSDLHHIKTMMEFSIEDTSRDAIIERTYKSMVQTILIYIDEECLPEKLEWIAIETTIRRFNLIGVESNVQDTVSSLSTTYRLDPFTDFYIHLDRYIENRDSKRRIRML